jgi:putative ABC transport system substrate-binding protein
MRRYLIISTLCSLILLGAACGSPSGSRKRVYTIGAFQMVPDPAVDAVRDAFVQALADAEYKEGENVRFDFQNAQGEVSNTQPIAQKFVTDKVDMIFAIGTAPLQAVVQAAPATMPVVFAFVSDPWGAGAGTSLTEHLPNVVGILNTSPLDAEVALIKQILPDARRVGLIYNADEPNSRYEAALLKEAAAKEGLEVVEQTVADPAEVLHAAQVLAGQGIQAFAKVGDYATLSAFQDIVRVGKEMGIPVFSITPEEIQRGALATVGWDYFEEGYVAGRLAVRVIKGESPTDIAFQLPEKKLLSVNLKAAQAYGVTVPAAVVAQADEVVR